MLERPIPNKLYGEPLNFILLVNLLIYLNDCYFTEKRSFSADKSSGNGPDKSGDGDSVNTKPSDSVKADSSEPVSNKSEIMLVHEYAMRLNKPINFEVTFTYNVIVVSVISSLFVTIGSLGYSRVRCFTC